MSMRNPEGYLDLTAGLAIAKVAKERKNKIYWPLVHIASPFSGDTQNNIERAREYCRFAITKECIPLAPHLLYPQFMDDKNEVQRDLGLWFALVLLGKCDELWAFGDRISVGMAREIARARRRGMPVKHFNDNCEEVIQWQ